MKSCRIVGVCVALLLGLGPRVAPGAPGEPVPKPGVAVSTDSDQKGMHGPQSLRVLRKVDRNTMGDTVPPPTPLRGDPCDAETPIPICNGDQFGQGPEPPWDLCVETFLPVAECDEVHCGTDYENNCPGDYENDGYYCDCGCQFWDPDCPNGGEECFEPAEAYVFGELDLPACGSLDPVSGWSQWNPVRQRYLFCPIYTAGTCQGRVCLKLLIDLFGQNDPEEWWQFDQQCCSDSGCDDGEYCNGQEICVDGACLPGPPPCDAEEVCCESLPHCREECCSNSDCNDDNDCTDDVCVSELCQHPPITGGPCDDGLFCTDTDECNDSGTCVGSGDPCAGGTECNNYCNESTDDCYNPPETPCTDGICCNGECTAPVCSADADCDDSDACTTDTCTSPGTCSAACANNPAVCDDGNPCTDDSCSGGACQYANNTNPCDDGLCCTDTDECDGRGTCVGSGDPCEGGGECKNHCNEGTCDCHNEAGTPCGEGPTPCSGQDTCDGEGHCDANHFPPETPCDDGLFCTDTDECDGSGNCVGSGDPCPPDADCNNHCNESTDNCYNPRGTPCGEGPTPCSGQDTCDGEGHCDPNHFGVETRCDLGKLLAFHGAVGDSLGRSVAVCDDITVVGAPEDDDNGIESGSAYVFRYDGSIWLQEAKLLASDGVADDWFGISVACSGDTVVIGAYGDDDNGCSSGSAYVFRYDGSNWGQEAKLLGSDGAEGDWFGFSVGVSGDTAVIGARYDDDNEDNSGSAYVFHYDGSEWSEEAKLLPSDGAESDLFGEAVAVSGDTAVIGAPSAEDNAIRSGLAYVFGRYEDSYPCDISMDCETVDLTTCSGGVCQGVAWAEEARLLPHEGEEGDQFGASVDISGDTAVIGAPQDDNGLSDTGSAYVFEEPPGGWGSVASPIHEDAKLTAPAGTAAAHFGRSVAISGDTAVIGVPGDPCSGADSGSAYVFRRHENSYPCVTSTDCEAFVPATCSGNVCQGVAWVQEAKLLASEGAAGDSFGASVAVSGDIAVIGARGDDDNGIDSGSAYTFSVGDADGNGIPNACDPLELASCEVDKPSAPDGTAYDYFGHSVAVSGSTAVFGAYKNDDNGDNSGSAYVFRRYEGSYPCVTSLDCVAVGLSTCRDTDGVCEGVAWVPEDKLLPNDGAEGDYFGVSVAVSAHTAVIGAYGDDHNGDYSGSAYVFGRDNNSTPSDPTDDFWVEVAKLLPSDGALGDEFGHSVALYGWVAVIGAWADDDNGNNSGSVYVFVRPQNGWDSVPSPIYEDAKLTASDGAALDSFGVSVAIAGGTAVIGAYGNDDNGNASGSAYVFVEPPGGWRSNPDPTQDAKLTASDGVAGDWFGISVAISADTAVIGAFGDDDNGDDAGSAYVFVEPPGGWDSDPTRTQDAKLTASDGAEGDYFGLSVACYGDTAVIGAPGGDGVTANSGSAYVFVEPPGGWDSVLSPIEPINEDGKLTASDGAAADQFGRSVALSSGGNAVIGAPEDDDDGTNSGSAYVFDVGDADSDGVPDPCDPCPNDNPDDTDGDGVCASDDNCRGTPIGLPVDEDGCRVRLGPCCLYEGGGICIDDLDRDTCVSFNEKCVPAWYLGDGLRCGDDEDGDGVSGCHDVCPLDPNKSQEGICGCGVADNDADEDGVVDCQDHCLCTPIGFRVDQNGCTVTVGPCCSTGGCDDDTERGTCESAGGRYLGDGLTCVGDWDGDGVAGCQDGCPLDPNKSREDVCGCGKPDDDTDGDGVADCKDDCPDTLTGVPINECGCPAVGACCSAVGGCFDDFERDLCSSIGGDYQGDGSVCGPPCGPPDPLPALTLTSPNGGEEWEAGTTQTIAWTWTGNLADEDYVEIALFKGNEWWLGIYDGAMPDGSRAWDICPNLGDGTDYTIHLTWWPKCSAAVEAVSDPFRITGSLPLPTLTLISPNGGEVWEAGTTQTVTWDVMWDTKNPVGYVDIWLLKGGEYYDRINDVCMADGSYTWDVPAYVGDGTDYTVRVAWYEGCRFVYDESDNTFRISSPPLPTLTLTSPNGGEVWEAGTTQTITWSSTDPTGEVELWLLKGGDRWEWIGRAPMEDGRLAWDICPYIGDGMDYTVEVSWSHDGHYVADCSDSPFEIMGSLALPTLTLTSPNGGEVWEAGTKQVITWDVTSPEGEVCAYLYLSKDGEWYAPLGCTQTAEGSLSFELCHYLEDGQDYTVCIEWRDRCGFVEHCSDAFKITGTLPLPTLELTSPNGGEVWEAGTTQTITWDSTNPTGEVELWLLKGDDLWERIGLAPMADGQLIWEICPYVGDGQDYTVCIEWHDGCGFVQDCSDEFFEITGSPTITVTSPRAGTVWQAGRPQTIEWTSDATEGHVGIALFEGDEWRLWIDYVPIFDHSVTWDISPDVRDATDYTIHLTWWPDCGPAVEAVSEPFAITTLTLTSPNGGEVWEAGTTQTVTWSSTYPTGEVALWLLKGGGRCERIGLAPMADEQLSWEIGPPIGDGSDYTVLISWCDCRVCVTDESDAPFEITGTPPPPTITVTSPGADTVWQAGTTQTIEWTSDTTEGYVEIALFKGDEWQLGIDDVPISDRSVTWDISLDVGDGTDYTIHLKWWPDCGPAVEAARSEPFEITAPLPTLTLTSPNGGEVWEAGTTQTITWDSTKPTGDVELWLPKGGDRRQWIGLAPMEDGRLAWEICPYVGDGIGYTVQISWSQDGHYVADSSDSPFEIMGSSLARLGACCLPQGGCFDNFELGDCCLNIEGVYQGDGSVCADGCGVGDFDTDGDVDLFDLALFQRCFTGTAGGVSPLPECSQTDTDGCGTIDLRDFEVLPCALTGPQRPGPAGRHE